jgi:hypothetical protein
MGGNIDVERTSPRMSGLPAMGNRAKAKAQNEPTTIETVVALTATTALFTSDSASGDRRRTRS